MELIVENLRRDNSNGHNFDILFDSKISLGHATTEIANRLAGCPNSSMEHFCDKSKRYGHIELSCGELTVVSGARGLIREQERYDAYKVTENNMDFSQMQEVYCFLEEK